MPGWAACATPVSQAGGGTWQAHSRAGRDVCRLRATASQLKPHQLNRRSEQPVGQAETQRVPPLQPGQVAWPGGSLRSPSCYLWGQWPLGELWGWAFGPFDRGSCSTRPSRGLPGWAGLAILAWEGIWANRSWPLCLPYCVVGGCPLPTCLPWSRGPECLSLPECLSPQVCACPAVRWLCHPQLPRTQELGLSTSLSVRPSVHVGGTGWGGTTGRTPEAPQAAWKVGQLHCGWGVEGRERPEGDTWTSYPQFPNLQAGTAVVPGQFPLCDPTSPMSPFSKGQSAGSQFFKGLLRSLTQPLFQVLWGSAGARG